MRRLLLAVIATFTLSAAAAAQTIPSPYRHIETRHSLAPVVGYVATDRGEPELGPHSAPLIGARYTARLGGPLYGEVFAALLPSARTILTAPNPSDLENLSELGEADALLLTLQGGLRLQLTGPRTWRDLAPFLSLGGGLIVDLSGGVEAEEAIPSEQRFDFGPGLAVSPGIGVDWFVNDRYSLRLELHDHLWRVETPEGLTTSGEADASWTHNPGLSIGAAYHF